VLSTAGDHVPEILLVLVAGRLNASPLQMSAMGVKLGFVSVFTSTVIVSIVAHCPPSGVNV
jgi:hypothetical protein